MEHDNVSGKDAFSARHRFHPGRVVNICFIAVLIFSTLLTWREAVVLEDAYAASQKNHLETVVNSLDRQLEFSVEKLLFFRNGMRDALETPLASTVLHNTVSHFRDLQGKPFWQLTFDVRRTLPLNGVSDAFVRQTTSLIRDEERLERELSAAFEMGYLLRIDAPAAHAKRVVYVSRAGFYVSTEPADWGNDIISRYYQLVTRPWYTGQSERENRTRSVRWFTQGAEEGTVTVSVPVDYQHYWYGALGIDFTLTGLKKLLQDAVDGNGEGEFQLYDNGFNLLVTSESNADDVNHFDERERAQIAAALEKDTEGDLRLGSRYVNWQHLDHFDGVVLRIHTLREGANGDFGSITIALALLWLLFTGMLVVSWIVIRRMVSNMYRLQHSLQWQAWHDPLTRINNRGALFERAKALAKRCEQHKQPYSVLQMDLDHFKSVNDRFGHQVGDKVLTHAAGLITRTIRERDVAGRVGGEGFCVVLPDTGPVQAMVIAQRIRERINRREILVKKSQTTRVSVSIGVSSAQESGNYDFEQLQSIADARLYEAKQRGRNQVVGQDEKK
ncbi:cellulose biosynthesis regulator diguanylate cyclase DgcQ [Leclercia adecarboxylata]|uniref:cellulose biosynthesis regulator diguanylate cyclase DgcQ n=1 Tax=Leclercia adecarboxylata TaxID=83655 RepID=UPI00111AFE02|nr:cellulose biosynthesis regulator diguanylate cyclase DgcQ [Leclercia adecarboxylata]QCZ25655.1 cellulose biosynthesis regulator YedQ [Leclercia adecarboxylata]